MSDDEYVVPRWDGGIDQEPPEQDAETIVQTPDLWTEREVFTRIHGWARSRMVAPTAVLGSLLARVAAAVPPFVVLPPIIGGYATLDLFVAQVGTSGGGKGAGDRVAGEMLHLDMPGADPFIRASVGSGEGISHLFAKRTKEGVEQHTTSVLMDVAEVDTLAALKGRQGSTLLPELRKAWSGETLGFAYADPQKRLPVLAHTYRLCVLIGVQPARADVLFDDVAGGTPQRMLWVETEDPTTPDEIPDDPPQLTWKYPLPWPTAPNGKTVLAVCDEAQDTIQQARLERLRGHGDALDGHTLLCRLKVAAILGLLDGRTNVSEDDWRLATRIMRMSDRTRENARAVLQKKQRDKDTARGRSEGHREIIKSEMIEGAETQKAGRAIMTRLRNADGWMSHGDLRRSLRSSHRPYFDDAIQRLIEAGQIEAETGEYQGQPSQTYRALAGGSQ